jgi:hypothetical protein
MPSQESQDKTGAILSRFPGPVTLAPSRTKWILILLGCAVFVAIALFAMQGNTFMRWGGIAFFGTGMAVAIVGLLPGASRLKLDREGFEFTALFRRHSVRWQAATGFEAVAIPPSGLKMVVFDDAGAKGRALGKFSVSLVGRNSGVPDTYGMSAEDLAGLMAQWRERAVSRR